MNRNFSLKHEFQPQNGDPRRHRRNLIWLIQDGPPCTAERSPYVTPEDFVLEESNSGRRQPKTFVAHFATPPHSRLGTGTMLIGYPKRLRYLGGGVTISKA